jgi:hypothetical protein
VSGGGTRHWVLIETGANQAYIFDTNRLRHAVGASYLVRELGTSWVPGAARAHGVQMVLAISGKALLLTPDAQAGRAVIGEVSERALRDAPGLQVTGVVGPSFDPGLLWRPVAAKGTATAERSPLTHVEALADTYELLETARQDRPPPELRDPLLPWFEVCRDSGFPVAGVERHADKSHAAASVLAKSNVRGRARDRMRDLLRDLPGVVPEDLDALRDDGWIAVIHADGNGVGQIFTDFAARAARGQEGGALSLDRHAELLKRFTDELEVAAETALGIAVRTVTAGQDARDTILAVVIGGDDVTVVCHARFALGLAREFTLAFEELTAAQPTVRAIADANLTAAAGIAYVKPHHPFSAAYALAEELSVSAKRFKQVDGRAVSAVDLHVAFESTLGDLAGLRARLAAGGLPRHGGPYVITAPDSPPAGVRDIAELVRTMETVSALSSSMAHDLREGLAMGAEEYARRLSMAERSPDLPDELRPDDISHLAPVTADEGAPGGTADGQEDGRVVRVLDALLLDAIARPAASPGADPGAGDMASAVPS